MLPDPITLEYRVLLYQILETKFDISIYVLSELQPQQSEPEWVSHVLGWSGSIAIILAFGLVQGRISLLPEDWFQSVLFTLSILIEIWLIWVWNSLYELSDPPLTENFNALNIAFLISHALVPQQHETVGPIVILSLPSGSNTLQLNKVAVRGRYFRMSLSSLTHKVHRFIVHPGTLNMTNIKEILIGKQFPTSMDLHERLDKIRALAVFASDPISSNAYATEAIMSVLIVLGSQALGLTWHIGLAVAALVILVIFSYIQTILHYPGGGGAYTVAKDNLGIFPSLLAAAALLTDYILTVSVSVSAGVRAVTSAFPETFIYRIEFAILAIIVITWMNLRGVRESGTVFAIPTYAFVGGVLLTILIGLVRYSGILGAVPLPVVEHQMAQAATPLGFAYLWLLLRAFAGGCTALTGIEAISNGVQAFKPPESKNAAATMVIMGVMAMSLFVGITYLSTHMSLIPEETESILSQMTRAITGGNFLYNWVQFFTAGVLFLAANTAYQDFPRLSAFLSNDDFMPRWMQVRGTRLVFSSGIVVLSMIASLIVLVFRADEIAMLPLYALGVMLSFSLSQTGMFRLMGRIAHLKPGQSIHTRVTEIHYERGTRWKQALNAVGAVATFIVFVILMSTKFLEGAWIVVLIIPLLVTIFYSIHHHYERVASALSTKGLTSEDLSEVADVVVVPIADVHRGTLRALMYAKRISMDVRAICVTTSPEMKERLLRRWKRFFKLTRRIKLITIDYDYRDILTPFVQYIQEVNEKEFPDQLTTVVIPAFIPTYRVGQVLHNQTAARLRSILRSHKDIVIIDVPTHIDSKI